MDTKSKRSRAGAVWLCFFLSLNILLTLLIGAVYILPDVVDNYDNLRTILMDYVLNADLKNTEDFRSYLAQRFDLAARWAAGGADNPFYDDAGKALPPEQVLAYLEEREGSNLLYYAYSPSTRETISNLPGTPEEVMEQLPDGYDYYLYYDGRSFTAWKNGEPLDVYVNDSGYGETILRSYMTGITGQDGADIQGCRILLVARRDFVRNPSGYSSMYSLKENRAICLWTVAGVGTALLLGLSLLVLSLLFRRGKREFDRKLASLLGRPWLEVRLLLSLAVLSLVMTVIINVFYYSSFSGFVAVVLTLLTLFWWLYLVILDLYYNRSEAVKNNFIRFMLRLYRSFEARLPFQRALRTRVYVLIGAEAGLIVLASLSFLFLAAGDGEMPALLLFLASVGLGIYILFRWLRRYGSLVRDLGELVTRIEAVKNGDLTIKPPLRPGADLYDAAENLGRIQEGIGRAVRAGVKSERMKLELVTNVAHDLKTPLTSIISYADLLATEQELPEQAKEYAGVLVQKAERLKTLIQDLFDLSRAASGDMELDMELLDLSKLIEQTLGDLSEEIAASPLIFRVNLPERPVVIESDGRKLYRVFLNLLTNALKYSLPGSRVYVELTVQSGRAVAAVKNTAGAEMDFDGEEILERFVRGDKARSTEGSGLGLSIAQSFTRACGGSFAVLIDGDLFKVTVGFPLTPQQTLPVIEEPIEEPPQDAPAQEA